MDAYPLCAGRQLVSPALLQAGVRGEGGGEGGEREGMQGAEG